MHEGKPTDIGPMMGKGGDQDDAWRGHVRGSAGMPLLSGLEGNPGEAQKCRDCTDDFLWPWTAGSVTVNSLTSQMVSCGKVASGIGRRGRRRVATSKASTAGLRWKTAHRWDVGQVVAVLLSGSSGESSLVVYLQGGHS